MKSRIGSLLFISIVLISCGQAQVKKNKNRTNNE